jgi:hypothetical protein
MEASSLQVVGAWFLPKLSWFLTYDSKAYYPISHTLNLVIISLITFIFFTHGIFSYLSFSKNNIIIMSLGLILVLFHAMPKAKFIIISYTVGLVISPP